MVFSFLSFLLLFFSVFSFSLFSLSLYYLMVDGFQFSVFSFFFFLAFHLKSSNLRKLASTFTIIGFRCYRKRHVRSLVLISIFLLTCQCFQFISFGFPITVYFYHTHNSCLLSSIAAKRFRQLFQNTKNSFSFSSQF